MAGYILLKPGARAHVIAIQEPQNMTVPIAVAIPALPSGLSTLKILKYM